MGEVERRRTEPPDARHRRRDRAEDAGPLREIAMPHEGDASRDEAVAQVPASRHAQPLVVTPRAPVLFRPIAFIGERLIDQAGRDLPLLGAV